MAQEPNDSLPPFFFFTLFFFLFSLVIIFVCLFPSVFLRYHLLVDTMTRGREYSRAPEHDSPPGIEPELDEPEDVVHAWANRTFYATCYKFTMQGDPAYRRRPLYSFLTNWYLHTMYNKSQKMLLGLDDITPAVNLAHDDFMFTPPPPITASMYLQLQYELDADEDDENSENGEQSHDDTDFDDDRQHRQQLDIQKEYLSREIIDEGAWMANDSTSLGRAHHFCNNNANGDDPIDEQDAALQRALAEYNRATCTRQRGPSSSVSALRLAATSAHENLDTANGHDTRRDKCANDTMAETRDTRHVDRRFFIDADSEDDDSDNDDQFRRNRNDARHSWRQQLSYSLWFLSQRLVESAYLVVELAEQLIVAGPRQMHNSSFSAQSGPTKWDHALELEPWTTQLSPSPPRPASFMSRALSYLLRTCRVLFLGIEIILNQNLRDIKSMLLTASSSHSCLVVTMH
ncbi:hypothetical protein BC940DRAFT_88656 [Gongronella butleri]|nr:hypothetical protein BC940DRAFT_88656 [Gongronella butleri]